MRCQILVSLALCTGLSVLAAAAQTPPAFEAASIRKVVSPDIIYGVRPRPRAAGTCLTDPKEAAADLGRACRVKRVTVTSISAVGMTLDTFASGIGIAEKCTVTSGTEPG